MTGTAGPVLRAGGPADDQGIRAVIAASFDDNPKSDPRLTAWQYWNNPFGPTRAWVWEDDGRIVACYVAVALPMVLRGRPALGSSGIDAAVHPDYQGRRLFRPLAEALYHDCGRHGMQVTLCFATNPAALAGIAAAGWIGVSELRLWVLPVDDAWVGRRFHLPAVVAAPAAAALRRAAFRHRRSLPADTAVEVGAPPHDVDELWATTAATTDNGVARGAAWFQWRYALHPTQHYQYFEVRRGARLAALAVTTTREAFGGRFTYLLDLMALDAPAAGALGPAIGAAASEAATAGVAVLALPGDRVETLARAAGLRRMPHRLVPRPTWHGAVPNVSGAPDPASTRWSFSWGELDHL